MTYTRRGHHRRGGEIFAFVRRMYVRKLRNTTDCECEWLERLWDRERETFIEAVCGLSALLFLVVNVSHGRGVHDDAKYLIASRDSLTAPGRGYAANGNVNKTGREKPPSCVPLLLLWISSNSRPFVVIPPSEFTASRVLHRAACGLVFITWRNLKTREFVRNLIQFNTESSTRRRPIRLLNNRRISINIRKWSR